jgi:hypothetical protein
LAGNSAIGPVFGAVGGGISNSGTLTILNSTIAGNSALGGGVIFGGGGLSNSGAVTMQNTILALNNNANDPDDCSGPVTSLNHNLMGDPTGCAVALGPNDLTGDPGIGEFMDDGTPGNGHFPLLSDSAAIDRGNSQACPETDQLGFPRLGDCDIGAIEFLDKIMVAIEVRPRSINPESRGRLRVAILTSELIDAATIKADSVRFGATGAEAPPVHFTLTDVDRDKDRDLVLHFET